VSGGRGIIPAGGGSMQSTGPLVRASHLKDDLEALAKLGAGVEAEVRARVPGALLARVADSARSEWLPIELNVTVVEAVHAVAGEVGLRLWGRESLLLGLTSFFRPLVQTATALFDPTPAAICRFAPRAWLATYRDAGSLRLLDVEAHELKVALVDFPEPLRRTPFLLAFAGTFEATYVFCAYTGTVEVLPLVDGTNPGFVVSWARRPT